VTPSRPAGFLGDGKGGAFFWLNAEKNHNRSLRTRAAAFRNGVKEIFPN
jgi:hypothetical protein